MLLNMAADDGGDSLLRRESSPARTTAAASDSVLQISPIRPKSRPRSISVRYLEIRKREKLSTYAYALSGTMKSGGMIRALLH